MDPFAPDLGRDIILVRPDGQVVHVRPKNWPVQFCACPDCPNSTGRCICSSPKRFGGEQVSLSDRPDPTASFDGASAPPANSLLKPINDITSNQTQTAKAKAMAPAGTMMYNEYGDLVDANIIATVVDSKTMEVTKMIRLIHLNFHHQFKRSMGEVVRAMVTPVDGKSPILLGGELLSWEFKGTSIPTLASTDATPEGTAKVAIYDGTPHVLEIGCDQGSWCFRMKEGHPDWIIEGLDSAAKWRLAHPEIEIKDFMDGKVNSEKPPGDYFSRVHTSQTGPEFTVRDFNSILNNPNPIPHNLYGLVRGRDVFAKIESYKTFLEDVRLILQPDGVVEFLEIDPRPRLSKPCDHDHVKSKAHKSGPEIDYTETIADRFKNPYDEELATDVPAWASRVAERIQASLRPRDGVPAANLKDWIQGEGFWDVKQLVIKLPVGGSTQAGTLLKKFIIEQIEMEDEVPRIRDAFPKIEEDKLASGLYHLNLHIVTGRKPLQPRPGDFLLDGTRMEMDDSKYDAMARFSANPKGASHWQRYDGKGIDNMMEDLHLK